MPKNAHHGSASPPDPDQGTRKGWTNPTPLDALFIVSAAVTLLLFLLWVLFGGRYSNAPGFLVSMANSVWAKVSFAGGSAGALLLRRFLDKSPAPNYLLWIPSFLAILIAALFLLSKVMPPVSQESTRAEVRMSLDKQLEDPDDLRKKYQLADFNLWGELPAPGDVLHGVIYDPGKDPNFPYRDSLIVKQDQMSLAYIKLNPALSHTQDSGLKWDYEICLNASAKRPSQGENMTIALNCVNGRCAPATPQDPGYVVACQIDGKSEGIGIPVVFASEQLGQSREPGWDVPFPQTLEKMNDRERVGYTLFDVSFTPQGVATQAGSYYYALRVNDKPVYIGGLSPGVEKQPLQQGALNHIIFALENLNFTGQYEGFEKLHLSVYFSKGDTVVFRQDLDREYAALRDAKTIPPLQAQVGTFQWVGKYIVPKNENKYEVMLASSECGDPPRKDCVDRAVTAKTEFDRAGLKFDDRPVVMVVRPPLRNPPAYGLTLGLVQPTGQVQFTFDAAEASQVCHWAEENAGKGKAGRLIRPDVRRYEVATRGYAPCH